MINYVQYLWYRTTGTYVPFLLNASCKKYIHVSSYNVSTRQRHQNCIHDTCG